ncbi:uncharacterized protein LOC144921530 isoform X1 [Branchiostoma floridae x Branchiostoma belcheri]
MFWGLTLEVGKQYTQIVEEGFHITKATLDPLTIKSKEGDGVYILRVRHNKQDYVLCTLDPSLRQYSQPLDLRFCEGEEVSFFMEGSDKGTLHLTGYLAELQSMPPEEIMLDSDMDEEMSSEEEEEEEESSEDEEVPNGLSLHALTAGDELEDESEDEWAPNSGKSKKRKRVGVPEKGKKKRKKSASSSSTSTPGTGDEEGEEEEELSDELDDEEDSEEFDFEDEDEDDEDESEEEEEDSEEEVQAETSMDSVRGVLDFEENEMSDSASGEDSAEEESETTHSEPSTPGDTPEVTFKRSQQQVKSNKKGQPQGQKTAAKQKKDVETPAGESLTGKKKKAQQQGKTTEKGAPQTKKETPQTKAVNGESPSKNTPTEQTQTASQKKKNKRKSGKEFQDGAKPQPANEQAAGPNSNKKKAGTPGKQVLPGGLVVLDRELGTGKIAKAGRRVGLYYKGTLAQNNKHFDSHLNGKPFTFTLGHGEVIKGWDMGVQGMKIGGKRRLEIPPAMAYGSQRVGPIPANSKLIFEVELKSVS